jgi:hypothetical protein
VGKESIQIRIAPYLLEWIDEEGAKNDRSRSWLINEHLRQAYEQVHDRQQPSTTN